MTYTARSIGRIPVVTTIGRGVLEMTAADAWEVRDEHGVIAQFIGDAVNVECYAQRIAELLNRHGLIDVEGL